MGGHIGGFLVAEGEEVVAGIDEHDGHEGTADSVPFGRTEEDIVQSVVAGGGEHEQVVLEIALPLGGFADKGEGVLARQLNLIGEGSTGLLRHGLDVGDHFLDVAQGLGTVVVGLKENEVRPALASQVGAYLRLIDFLFEHRDGHENAVQGFDVHRGGDEQVRSALLTAVIQMVLNNA